MSGGAARGLAGIGVLRALEELDIPVDAVCGVSMGAMIAAAYADDCDPDDALALEASVPSPAEEWHVRT